MRIKGAVIKEQGITFAVVIVKRNIIQSKTLANQAICEFEPLFSGCPVVLMAQDSRGCPTFFGRQDIARFLSNVPVHRIPWRWYSVN